MWCAISTPDSRLLTGKGGETLAAINHIVRKIVEKSLGAEGDNQALWNVVVDVNNYQKKRIDNVKAIAQIKHRS
jgi:predicted RNA-binding protein Jag